jgi:hypothetical protein
MVRESPVALLCLAALALGCGGPPRIDTSSEQSAAASLKQLRESLPERMRPAFDEAVRTVVLSRFGEDAVGVTEAGPEAFGAAVLEPLNGMTADEVLTEAQRIIADREARRGARAGEPRAPPQ